ncbi:MAG: acyl carrier protein [Lachnospiraceae bacterium]|jgi:acyl carrier protein|nr:acyl carrier protein [Lachnospiraceae bacterium]MBQ7601182.1 acyl carrier protein [Lachnospiraceae bacterium]MBR5339981.1 acyl carrier protein [Lachnospiraceae bacterium]
MLEKIREILEEELNIDPEDVNEDSDFRDDLGIDSLDLFELVMNLENEYGVEFPAEELESLRTVGDVIDFLEKNNVGM